MHWHLCLYYCHMVAPLLLRSRNTHLSFVRKSFVYVSFTIIMQAWNYAEFLELEHSNEMWLPYANSKFGFLNLGKKQQP